MQDNNQLSSRRGFLQKSISSLAVGGTLAAVSPELFAHTEAPHKRLRLAMAGTGIRGITMWGPSVEKDFSDRVQMVGLCDINAKRVKYAQSLFKSNPPAYTDFDKMVQETSPDVVIVTTIDCFHVQYAVRAMELGCDVICEKPLATTAQDCQILHETERKTGRTVTVTFNARYFSEKTKIKELLSDGVIGDLYSIDYAEMLDLTHGASYFRRWHGLKANSGTLLCQKASHHFDQVNWWVDSDPAVVTAFGQLRKYGTNGAFRSTHCRACQHKEQCDFYWDITKDKWSMDLYVNCEDEDGYLRDACLFREEIDIEDTVSLQCKYNNGVLLTYSLNAASPIEGQFIALNGSKGRIELRVNHRQPWEVENNTELRLITNDPLESRVIHPKLGKGSHGGADVSLKKHIFDPKHPDPLGHRAGSRAGILSAIIGIAGYTSIETGRPVEIQEIIDM